MFYRALVVGIIVFWSWMTASLVRMEWFSQAGESISVPTAYVWKLMFLHEESSDLVVYNQRVRMGSVHLQPHRGATGGSGSAHMLTGYGNFVLDLPWLERQSAVVRGSLELDAQNEPQRLKLTAVLHAPKQTTNGITLDIDGSPVTGKWHYECQQDGEILREGTGTIAELLDAPELRGLPFDPKNLARMEQEQVSRVAVSAHRGKLAMNGEQVDTFVVTIKDGNGLENTVHFSPLGQILAVKTFAGFQLLDGSLNP